MKKAVLTELLAIAIVITLVVSNRMKEQDRMQAVETSGRALIEREVNSMDWMDYPIADVALINSYLDMIREESQKFYESTYYVTPEIVWYMTKVKEIKSEAQAINPTIYITFETTPFLGAHNPISDDEITIEVDSKGEKKIISYPTIT